MPPSEPRRVLVLGCGALVRELQHILRGSGFDHVSIHCLPAKLHNRPELIPGQVAQHLDRSHRDFDRVFVAYADCGTGGRLDEVLDRYQVERLPGAHCYEFFAGSARFHDLGKEEPGTFYLTDYLVRHFETIVWRGLGLDRHPELLDAYFHSYRRVVYLAQTDATRLTELAERTAARLGLELVREYVGYGELEPALMALGRSEDRLAAVVIPAAEASR